MELKCKFVTLSWDGNQPFYTCLIQNLTITKPEQEIFKITGKHIGGKTNVCVEAVCVENSAKFAYFPKRLGKFFPSLTAVFVKNTGLKELTKEDLEGLDNVRYLYFHMNQLTSLPVDLLENMKKLTQISFWKNRLLQVSSLVLKPVIDNGLSKVDFSDNIGINVKYFSDGTGCGSLKELMAIMDMPPLLETILIPADNSLTSNFMANLLNATDFMLVSSDHKEFRVHKRVLAYASSFFARAFIQDSEMFVLNLPDFRSDVVEALLTFIYTGSIPDVRKNVMDLTAIATKLECPHLRTVCEASLLKFLDVFNCYEYFLFANRFELITLKQVAFDEIRKMFPGEELPDSLISNVRGIKDIVETQRNGKRKIEEVQKEVQEELAGVLKKYKK